MNAIIINTDPNEGRDLAKMLTLHCPHVNILGHSSTGDPGILLIQEKRPDLVFWETDISTDSLEWLNSIEHRDFSLVFITNDHAHAAHAFEMSALDYLVKPLNPIRLASTILKASEMTRQRNYQMQYQLLMELVQRSGNNLTALDHRIVFSTQTEVVFSWLRNLIRIDADTNCCYIKITDQKDPLHIAKNIGEYERLFEKYPYMHRVHRSHIDNLFHVKKYLREDGMLLMTDGMKIPVVSAKRDDVLHNLHALGAIG